MLWQVDRLLLVSLKAPAKQLYVGLHTRQTIDTLQNTIHTHSRLQQRTNLQHRHMPILILVDNPSRRRQRSVSSLQLDMLRTHRWTVGVQAFAAAGPTLWNSLPHDIADCVSLTSFCRKLKTFFVFYIISTTTFLFLVVLEVFTRATLKISYVCMYVTEVQIIYTMSHIATASKVRWVNSCSVEKFRVIYNNGKLGQGDLIFGLWPKSLSADLCMQDNKSLCPVLTFA